MEMWICQWSIGSGVRKEFQAYLFGDPINSTLIRCIQTSSRNINVLLVVPILIVYISFYIAKRLSMVAKGTLVILSANP